MNRLSLKGWVRIEGCYGSEQVYSYESELMTIMTKFRVEQYGLGATVLGIYDRLEKQLRDEIETGSESQLPDGIRESFCEAGHVWHAVTHVFCTSKCIQLHNYCFVLHKGFCIIFDSVVNTDSDFDHFYKKLRQIARAVNVDAVVDESGVLVDNNVRVKIDPIGNLQYSSQSTEHCALFMYGTEYASVCFFPEDCSPWQKFNNLLKEMETEDDGISFDYTGMRVDISGASCAYYVVKMYDAVIGYVSYFVQRFRHSLLCVFHFSEEETDVTSAEQLFKIEVISDEVA